MISQLFELGQLVATPGAIELSEQHGVSILELVCRHASGDFGDLCNDDKQLNLEAIQDGSRVMSSYIVGELNDRLWIITEAKGEDGVRVATTALRPDEY